MSNQFSSYTTGEEARQFLESNTPTARAVQELFAAMCRAPTECYFTSCQRASSRRDGRRSKVAVRAVLYYLHCGEVPPHGFQSPPSCGEVGCVNPLHQLPCNYALFSFTTKRPARAA